MKKIATILVTLLILSSIIPPGVSANDLEVDGNISSQTHKDNGQTVIEEIEAEGISELGDNVENSNDIVDENQVEKDITQERNEDKQVDRETNKEEIVNQTIEEDELIEEESDEQELLNEENGVNIESEESESEDEEVITEDAQSEIMMSMLETSPVQSSTSRLGHIRSSNVDIYKDINNLSSSFKAGSKYTNAVYYIKRQAKVDNQTYYLISTRPSSSNGVVGWIKASDLSTHPHVGVNKNSKTFSIKGTGNAYDTAWGGSKNLVYDLTKYKGSIFQVHLTEKVGNNTWYRGNLNGKTVWIHSSYLTSDTGSPTSRLGHIRRSNVDIYKDLNNLSSSFKAGSTYTNAVYYIKRQAKVNNQTYYLISIQASSTNGVIGWVKASDLSTHPHVGVDKQSKTFYVKGTGNSYDTAWGGSKNLVYKLSEYEGHTFRVHLTEKVGNNTWYRGNLNGKTVWIHSSYLTSDIGVSTSMLGHIRNSGVRIYSSLDNNASSFVAGSKYTNTVYYIKRQAKIKEQRYYLISIQPSSSKGVVGWVKASDLSSHRHVGVDKTAKTLYFKGTGSAYSKAWGGAKDLVHSNMSQYAGQEFKVNLTEKVGNNTWYRGMFNGKRIWLHSSYVTTKTESNTSRLGHLRANVKIYKNIGDESSAIAGKKYTNAVYYIKKQAVVNNQTYYLISTLPSSTNGVIGWVNSKDLSTHSHVGVDKKSKTLYFKGTGVYYSKAWGGSKDIVYKNMLNYKGQE